jgi:RNA polymerase sigma factor (TIGR02999 family)
MFPVDKRMYREYHWFRRTIRLEENLRVDRTGTITEALHAWSDGEPDAMERLMGLVYPRLRELARRRMSFESPAHTMRPTELVHEAYLRLAGEELSAKDRGHFYAICARLMRRILIDHARAQLRAKRGGGSTLKGLDGDG